MESNSCLSEKEESIVESSNVSTANDNKQPASAKQEQSSLDENENDDELNATSEVVTERLKTIAESGVVDIDWPELQESLKLRLGFVLANYIERNRGSDSKEDQYQEPNLEKFNLDSSKEEIFELITSFNEAPFTIQRICELLYSPFKYYDRISTFLRGLEKNLRVISSYNWPKSITSASASSDEHQQQKVQELRILPGT